MLFHIKPRICLKYFVHDCNTAHQGISKEVFSNEAKTALVPPLEKDSTKVDKSCVLNLSLLSVFATFSKIFDKVIKNHLMKSADNYFSPYLSAYRAS